MCEIMKKIHNLAEFLNDEKFISKKIKESYLQKGKFVGSQKQTVTKSFLKYYTSCEILKKERNKQQQIELGDEREQILNNDRRTTQQQTEIALIVKQALVNFLSLLSERSELSFELDSKIEDGYYCNTSFMYLFNLKLVDNNLKRFRNECMYQNAEQELLKLGGDIDLLIKNDETAKHYLSIKNDEWRKVFNQVLNMQEFKNNVKHRYVIVVEKKYKDTETNEIKTMQEHRFMTDDEQLEFESWEKELLKRTDIEKPKLFQKNNDKNDNYKFELLSFLDYRFNALRMYTKVCIKIGNYGNVEEVDCRAFRELYKIRTDKRHLYSVFYKAKKQVEYANSHSMKDDELAMQSLETELEGALEQAKFEFEAFNKLDIQNNIHSNKTAEMMRERYESTYSELLELIHSNGELQISDDELEALLEQFN